MSHPRTPTPLPCALGWERWQGSTVSKRYIPEQARQEGYAVLRVPRALRASFLAMATVCALYDGGFQKPKRALSPEHLAAFVTWHEATQALIQTLAKEQP